MTLQSHSFDFLKDVDVRLSVELGRTDMKLKNVLALGEESVVGIEERDPATPGKLQPAIAGGGRTHV